MPVIEGVNQYIEDLKNDDEGETLFSLTAFDTVFEHWHVAEAVENIPSIANRYQPRGGTALYDAIAHSIVETERKLKKMKRGDMKILHVTMTDGGENSSEDYLCSCGHSPCRCGKDEGRKRLMALVQSKEATGNWTFVYLGAGHANIQQAQAVGQSMGYVAANSMVYSSTPTGARSTTDSLAKATLERKHAVAASSDSFFADSGQTEADYLDPNDPTKLPTTPNPIVPQPGDVAKAADVITSKSLGDALKGQ